MGKFKLLMALFLVSALVFGMVSCSDGSDSNPYALLLAAAAEQNSGSGSGSGSETAAAPDVSEDSAGGNKITITVTPGTSEGSGSSEGTDDSDSSDSSGSNDSADSGSTGGVSIGSNSSGSDGSGTDDAAGAAALGVAVSIEEQSDIGAFVYDKSAAELSLTLADGYVISAYYIDNERDDVDVSAGYNTIEIDATVFDAGLHYIMVVAVDSNGEYYSANYTLNVE